MAKDYVVELRKLAETATENGWTMLANCTAYRAVARPTPDGVRNNGWWPEDTYESIEFLDFTFLSQDRVPIVVHKVTYSPWTTRADTKISYRKARELLAQPLSESVIY